MQRPWVRATAVVALVAAASVMGSLIRTFPGEGFTLDARFARRGERPLRGEVAIIAIDDHTLRSLGTTWPFSRAILGEAIDRLTELGAKVVGVDILLTEPQRDPGADDALAAAIRRAQRVVLISQLEDQQVSGLAARSYLAPMPSLEAGTRATGFYNFPSDSDGAIRRATPLRRRLLTDGKSDMLVSFATALTLTALGVPTSAAQNVEGELRARGTPVRMPVDRRGSFLIDFQGGAGHVPTYSLDRLLKRQLGADVVAGKIVIIGPTFRTSKDFLRTSASGLGDREMPGVEVHANAASQLLGGQAFSLPSRTLLALLYPLLLALVGLAAWLGQRVSRRLGHSSGTSRLFGLAGPAVLLTAYLAICQAAFNAYVALPVAAPLTFGLLLVATVLFGSSSDEARIGENARALPAAAAPVPLVASGVAQALQAAAQAAPTAVPAAAPVLDQSTRPGMITFTQPQALPSPDPALVAAPLLAPAAPAAGPAPEIPSGAGSGERLITRPEPEALAQTVNFQYGAHPVQHGPAPSVRFSGQRSSPQRPEGPTEPSPAPAQMGELPRARRFEFRRLLGRGGMGTVYEGYDRVLDESVAIKLMLPAALQDADGFERFLREVKLARRVTHPNVARVYDFIEEEGQQFIAMELLQGQLLRTRIDAGLLPPREAVKVATEVARGLEAVHKVGVVHRDLKPENIMLVPGRGAVVMDFGVARGTDQLRSTSTGAMVGTPQYMSPEQFHALPVDARSDLYSLGLMLFEMIEGEVPLGGRTVVEIALRRMSQPPPLLQRVPALTTLVARMLTSIKENRPASAVEVANELDRWLASST